MTKTFICINCPLSCRLQVETAGDAAAEVSGNRCRRGRDYALQEAVRPMRVLTGNMRAEGCQRPFSVRSSAPIPKELLLPCSRELKRVRPRPPIRVGDVVIRNILGTGADIVATRDT